MTLRRSRLSLQSLEDRTTPATASDLVSNAQDIFGTAAMLNFLSRDPMIVASPAYRSTVQSYFTAVYQEGLTTQALIAQFPDALPPGEAQVVGALAQAEANIAQMVGNVLGFTLTPAAASTSAPVTSTPGPISAATSTVAISPNSIAVGGTSTVTLTARDANGTALTAGGATVTFGLGTGAAQGTFGSVTDNGNGTYTATFTGTVVGANTITATVNGTTVTSTAPTVTVTAATGPDLANSAVSVSPSSVASGGTSTVTLTAKDASGNALTTGGATVAFGLGAGTGQGTFGAVTDNGDGTYTATFTGTTAGANTVTATVGGQAVTSTAPTITVTPGTASPGTSSVAVSPASIVNGSTATVTLTAKDAAGNPLRAGGSTVAFGLGAGATVGTFGPVTDNGDGTYTATFTGTTTGSNTITAALDTQPVTSTAPTVTVVGPADPAQSSVAISPSTVASGSSTTVTLTARDANGNKLPGGGSTVVFTLGSDVGQGTFGPVTDNGDGTYTATFTGTTVGTNTIPGSIDGVALTSTAPTVTVTAAPDLAQSTVSVSPASVASGGTSTVTLTAKDANGNALTTGGATVAFGLGSGTGQGTFGAVTDNGNGTYTATFTGTTAGTDTVTATVGGQPVTSAAPTITVTAAAGGSADPAQSTVALNPASMAVNGTSTVTLTARDAGGTPLTTGGSTVTFGLGAGATVGTFGPVTDNGNGTYSATFTGTTTGTNTVTATLDTTAVTSTAPTVTVT